MYQYYFKYYRKVEAACNFKSYFKNEKERERERGERERERDSMCTREIQSHAYNYKVKCTRNINLAMTRRGH